MWPYYPELLDQAVPRYTSYPTAADFKDVVSGPLMEDALAQLPAGTEASLYLHIPYCNTICWYCGCNTAAAGKRQRLESYLEALEAEIAMVGLGLCGRARIRRIAFGGGSPNAIMPVDFVRLWDRITTLLQPDCEEISVEVDPRIFTVEWARNLARCGVNRVSLGVQSFSPAIQQAIGRLQPESVIRACVEDLRRVGIDAINFDLMYGLPGQTLDDLDDSLERSVALAPSRIALFGYAHLPSIIPRQRRIDGNTLPDLASRFEMAALGHGRLMEAGYCPVGFDHFALPHDPLSKAAQEGRVHRNFQGFTDDGSSVLIGLGASAVSRLPDRYLQNEKNPAIYREKIARNCLTATRGVTLSDDDRIRGGIIEQLLCRGEATNVPPGLMRRLMGRLKPFTERGLARVSGSTVAVSAAGLPYARAIASTFDSFRSPASGSFSMAV